MSRKIKNIADQYYQQILVDNNAPGTKTMSTQEIADKYNVSFVTANRVINTLVEKGILYRKTGSGTYIKKVTQSSKKTLSIGIGFEVPPGPPEQVLMAFSVFGETAVKELRSAGHTITHLLKSDLQEPDEACLEMLNQLDGLLLSYNYASDPNVIKSLKKLAIPVVVVQHEILSSEAYHQVVPDMPNGLKTLAEYMLSIEGPKGNYALLYPTDSIALTLRVKMIKEALMELGVDSQKIRVFANSEQFIGDLGIIAGQELGETLLEDGFHQGIVFAAGDFIAFGLIRHLKKKKIDIGNALKVVSCDDLEGEGLKPFDSPFITSVKFPRKEVMQTAVSLLIRIIKSRNNISHTNIIRVESKLIKRASSGN